MFMSLLYYLQRGVWGATTVESGVRVWVGKCNGHKYKQPILTKCIDKYTTPPLVAFLVQP